MGNCVGSEQPPEGHKVAQGDHSGDIDIDSGYGGADYSSSHTGGDAEGGGLDDGIGGVDGGVDGGDCGGGGDDGGDGGD